jgi:hypothetical protein
LSDLPTSSPLSFATVGAWEETVLDSLTRATTVTGYKGRAVEAIPVEWFRKTA